MKQAMGDIDKDDLKYHVENFVLSVFAAADKNERTVETITKKNAMEFKRAGDFIQILSMFGEVYTDDWQEKKKYCIYKAGTIMKALKNGEQPERGNPFAPEEEKKDDPQNDPQNMAQDTGAGASAAAAQVTNQMSQMGLNQPQQMNPMN